MVIIWVLVTIFVVVAAVSAAWSGWRAAPYVPTLGRDVDRMMNLSEIKRGEKIVDLGAGDGRILLAAAKRGAEAVGYETSLGVWLVAWLRLKFQGARHAHIRMQDFYHQDLSGYDVVFCFLTPSAMKKLEPKLQQELKPGARVISAVFPMPNWPLDAKDKPDKRVSVYRYRHG